MTSASIATWTICRAVGSAGTPSSRAAAEICRASATSRSLSPPTLSRSQTHRHAVRAAGRRRGDGSRRRPACRSRPPARRPPRTTRCGSARTRRPSRTRQSNLVEPLRRDRLAHLSLLVMRPMSLPPTMARSQLMSLRARTDTRPLHQDGDSRSGMRVRGGNLSRAPAREGRRPRQRLPDISEAPFRCWA